MHHQCSHISSIHRVTPSSLGCEECLKSGSYWFICDYAVPVATWDAATIRPTAMPVHTFMRLVIPLSRVMTRRTVGVGVGAMSIASC